MANVSQNLGPVSAYAIAKKHGYQGTEQEWAQLQADSGENARKAEEAWTNVEPATRDAVAAAKQTAADAKQTVADAAQTAKDVEQTARDAEQATSAAERAEKQARMISEELTKVRGMDVVIRRVNAVTSETSGNGNLFDPDGVPILDAYSNGQTIVGNEHTKTAVFPCAPGTEYTASSPVKPDGRKVGVALTASPVPAIGDTVIAVSPTEKETGGRIYRSFKTTSNAKNILLYYYNDLKDTEPEVEFRKTIMIVEGVSHGPFQPYAPEVTLVPEALPGYLEMQGTIGAITQTERNPSQIFDWENATLMNAFTTSANGVQGSTEDGARTAVIPCESGKEYTVSLKTGSYSRFYASCADVDPVVVGTPVTYFNRKSSANGRDYISGTTSPDAKNLVVYYWNGTHDTVPELTIRKDLMVTEGADRLPYTPYSTRTTIRPEAIPEQSSDQNIDCGNSRAMVFGVEFDNAENESVCTRIGDAVGMSANYMIDQKFASSSPNDFDRAFPWCAIRRCNIKPDRSIVYEGEPGFALDGSGGDVFVEIPKFYSLREVIGSRERVMISGSHLSGFSCEPLFVDADGAELEFAYVGAYHTSEGAHSKTKAMPQLYTPLKDFEAQAKTRQYSTYDFATLSAIQKLCLIEYADRDMSKYFNGIGELPYYQSTTVETAAQNTNKVAVKGNNQLTFYRPGQWIAISKTAIPANRRITEITPAKADSRGIYHMEISFDGSPVNADVGDYVYCTGQPSGETDSIPYHTGRFADNYKSAFKYRWMENLWGNVWMQTSGIKVKNLEYYVETNPRNYSDPISTWRKLSFAAPLQNHFPGDPDTLSWIRQMGYDRKARQMMLPAKLETAPDHYGDKLYTKDASDTEYICVAGGGWDHLDRNGPFTTRFWSSGDRAGDSWLYGSRLVLRSDI